ncbi:MAG TPA: quinolinate synthase NadA [Terriglobia bacterium]|nr:quinolinate synthase NadA [Terriglobia bacterium]
MLQTILPDRFAGLTGTETESRIAETRRRLGDRLVILGHHYQRDDVIKFADFRGDSFKLAQWAAGQKKAEYIVFCGVHFMAESADILSADYQQVILPDLSAGCSMADMAEIDQVESCWEDLRSVTSERILPITYMNSSAAIKAFCGRNGGAVCTSSNAAAVMRWALERSDKILFLPDQHLGRNTAYKLGFRLDEMTVWDPFEELGDNSPETLKTARFVLWKGHCSVHQRFLPEHVAKVRARHPGITVISHPECRWEVTQLSDDVGSTEHIIKRVTTAPAGSEWAVGTEIHLVNRLKNENSDRFIIPLDDCGCLCATMFRIDAPHLLWALENLEQGRVVNRITVPAGIAADARLALNRMLEITQ